MYCVTCRACFTKVSARDNNAASATAGPAGWGTCTASRKARLEATCRGVMGMGLKFEVV